MRKPNISRFLQVCIDIAELADETGENGTYNSVDLMKELGLGYRALSGYLRQGIKEVIDLQNSLHAARSRQKFAEIGEQSAHDFLKEVFGDPEPYTINDKDKERIKAFVKSIMDEWDKESEDED